MLKLYCLRHGQPEGDASLLGSTDRILSESGWHQTEAAGGALDGIDRVISSPLKRCLEFATSWSHKNELPLEVVSGFKETQFGDWDGMSFDALWKDYQSPMSRFFDDPWSNPPPNAESPAEFSARIIESLEALIAQYSEHKILLVSHGGVIRTLIGWCLSLPLSGNAHLKHLAIDHGSLSLIEIYRDQATQKIWPRLIFSNYTLHD